MILEARCFYDPSFTGRDGDIINLKKGGSRIKKTVNFDLIFGNFHASFTNFSEK